MVIRSRRDEPCGLPVHAAGPRTMILDRELMAVALPGYRLGDELGRGAWGIVVAAEHRSLGRWVAVKQLPRDFATDEPTRERFSEEARLVARLDHPHIVKVFDLIEHEGMRLIVMEYLPGGSLWARFTNHGIDNQQACAVTLAMCAGLHSAHSHGVLHRDVKPENILLAADGTPRLSDFGVAKLTSGARTQTAAGTVMGTPAYLAPEQVKGEDLDARCDVYALGTMLYELLAGRVPFEDAESPAAMMYANAHTPPPSLATAAPATPAPLVDVVMRTLQKDPADRHQSAEALGVDLARAAAVSFGPGWLQQSRVPLIDSGPIAGAALDTSRSATDAAVTVGPVQEHGHIHVSSERDDSGDHGYHLGIDVGTTNTAVAVHRGGSAYVLHLGDRSATTPSAVFVDENRVMRFGDAAARRLIVDPGSVATEFKRRIGDPTPLAIGPSAYTAKELTTALLGWVLERAREREGTDPGHLTVCHPANWGEFKKQTLSDAVAAATDVPFGLITEPQAAAVYYASQERVPVGHTVVVYDLGGGTFDAAVLRKYESGFELLGDPEGVERLGGIDFDEALYQHVARRLDGAPLRLDLTDPRAASASAHLSRECRDAKEALSSDTETRISVMLPDVHQDLTIRRDELEHLARPTLADTIEGLRRAMDSAGVSDSDVGSILLVGGASRMPLVRELVASSLEAPVAVDVHPKHAVALGAAISARLGAAGPVPVGSDRPVAATIAPGASGPAAAVGGDDPPLPPSPGPPPGTPGPPGGRDATGRAGSTSDQGQPPGTTPPPAPPTGRSDDDPGRRSGLLWWIVGAAAVTVAGIAALLLFSGSSEPDPIRRVIITGGDFVDDRLRISYRTEGFEPRLAPDDPDAYNIHFFWNLFDPATAGTDTPAGQRAEFVAWDVNSSGAKVFDELTVDDVPIGATALCAVVADNTGAVHRPDLLSVTTSCINLGDG